MIRYGRPVSGHAFAATPPSACLRLLIAPNDLLEVPFDDVTEQPVAKTPKAWMMMMMMMMPLGAVRWLWAYQPQGIVNTELTVAPEGASAGRTLRCWCHCDSSQTAVVTAVTWLVGGDAYRSTYTQEYRRIPCTHEAWVSVNRLHNCNISARNNCAAVTTRGPNTNNRIITIRHVPDIYMQKAAHTWVPHIDLLAQTSHERMNHEEPVPHAVWRHVDLRGSDTYW